MIWKVDWDGGFVVGGDDNRRLTPHFRVKEFRNAAGAVRVHRDAEHMPHRAPTGRHRWPLRRALLHPIDATDPPRLAWILSGPGRVPAVLVVPLP